jgi:hypothetical protein
MCIPAIEMKTDDEDPSDYALPQLDMTIHAEASMVACEQQSLGIVEPDNDAIAHEQMNDVENRYRGSWASDIPTDCFAPPLRSSPPPSANLAMGTFATAKMEPSSKVVAEDNKAKNVERKRLKQQRKRRARAARRRTLDEQAAKIAKTYETAVVKTSLYTETHVHPEVTALKKAKIALATSMAMVKAATRTVIAAEKALAAAKEKTVPDLETATKAPKKKKKYYGGGKKCRACGKL